MKPVVDFIVVTFFLLSLFFFIEPQFMWLGKGAIYVSPGGSNWNSGRSRDVPLATIQAALDRASPGDSVIVFPGVYREWLRIRHGGEPGREIVIKAAQPGTVLISGEADPEIPAAFVWRHEGSGVFSARVPWPVYRVKGRNGTLYQPFSLSVFYDVISRPNAFASACYNKGRLYVWFPDRESPEQQKLRIHSRIPPPGLWRIWKSSNIWMEAGYIRLEGLRFDFGIGSAVHLWDSPHVTIRNCFFTGAETGVHGWAGIRPPDHLLIEHSLFHNYPQASWIKQGWLSWGDIYGFYSRSSLVRVKGDAVAVRNNLIVHGGDAIGVTTEAPPVRNGIDVNQNAILWCTDDAIEFDGHAVNVRVRNNLIYDTHVSFGTSPVMSGPVLIENNTVLHPAMGVNQTHLKLMNPWGAHPVKNILVSKNILVGRSFYYGAAPLEQIVVERNDIAVDYMKEPLPPGMIMRQNTMLLRTSVDTKKLAADFFARMKGRVGPAWLDWSRHKATAELLDFYRVQGAAVRHGD